jgi:capsule polysaccharide export protein KpsE/RkpR
MTEVAEDRKSGTIQLLVTNHDKKLAAQIATAYIEELPVVAGEVTLSAVRRERIFIEERLGAAKKDLQDADQQFSKFASERGAISLEEQAKVTLESAARLQGSLLAAEAQLRELQATYTLGSANVRTAQARIDELKQQFRSINGTSETSDHYNTEGSVSHSLRDLSTLGAQYVELYRNLKVRESVYEALFKQYEIVKMQEAQEIPAIKVIDQPEVAELKAGPSRLFICIMGTVLAAMLAFAWVVSGHLWGQLDQSDPRRAMLRRVALLVRPQSALGGSSRH